MFANNPTLNQIQDIGKNSMSEHVGIEFIEIGKDFLVAKMPVDARTQQPFGILHGGASVVLAETLGSVASYLCLPDPSKQQAVGLDINANHIRPVSEGFVYGKAQALHIGRSTHIWEIKITNEDQKLVCISRLTVAIMTITA
ncbi:1,4-dihydroxy-2-naphthoyl-CoA hydrolase [Dyadobacter jejuensis]|uniref:1,4-dihydroxy-2-naphthoyl-CoA hydrolase n=1 Tax=Dyadobacter jejuensis TaxID=1082580 RepID=A0A316AI88_9BACT|nr:hotdog fold thioesterase [Dyadobacter jejuensis]PWJ57413.1 1,4-dihydroxy-2-naphthoyl-CoA hydrolase [Dyadobacter jejuensis]